jgi:hypothetical protein
VVQLRAFVITVMKTGGSIIPGTFFDQWKKYQLLEADLKENTAGGIQLSHKHTLNTFIHADHQGLG